MSRLVSPQRLLVRILAAAIVLLAISPAAHALASNSSTPEVPSLDVFLQSLAPAGATGTPSPAKEGIGIPRPIQMVMCGRVPHPCQTNDVCVPCGADAYCAPPGTTCCNSALCYPSHTCQVTQFGAYCQ